MKKFDNFQNLPKEARGAVVAIGNFDGVHKGHRFLLKKAGEIARAGGVKLAALTFEPHPKRLFRPDEPPGRLTPPAVKAWRLAAEGADILYALPFDWNFASLSAADFIGRVLQEGAGAAHVVVGPDFRFGQLRKGGPDDIRNAGIPVTVIDEMKDENGAPYSSSRIREALRGGDIKTANELLGWEWEIWGEVVRGNRRGHELGYPTANMALGEAIHPAYGVYAAKVNIKGEDLWRGAAVNIGIRPMFEIPEAQVESHIFDFSRDIYGQALRVKPVKRLRSEAKFASLDELKKQMAEDCRAAREIL